MELELPPCLDRKLRPELNRVAPAPAAPKVNPLTEAEETERLIHRIARKRVYTTQTSRRPSLRKLKAEVRAEFAAKGWL